MKTTIFFISLALVTGLAGGYVIDRVTQKPSLVETQVIEDDSFTNGKSNGQRNGNVTKGNCVSDECLFVDGLEYPAGTLSDEAKIALGKAIDDEYKAFSTYEKTIETFGAVRPFSMIIRAEESHIASLKALFDKYGLEIPENLWKDNVVSAKTLQESCQTGVDAEIANAKLYREELLPAVTEYEDITGVFTNLMNASQEKHLVAFERCN